MKPMKKHNTLIKALSMSLIGLSIVMLTPACGSKNQNKMPPESIKMPPQKSMWLRESTMVPSYLGSSADKWAFMVFLPDDC